MQYIGILGCINPKGKVMHFLDDTFKILFNVNTITTWLCKL